MKKLLPLLLCACLLLTGCAAREAADNAHADTVVTSFYPIYVFALNLADGTPIRVANMTDPGTGCLHDYQLQTGDMKLLAQADALLINGAGMEGFLTDVAGAFPRLPVVDASTGIALLEDCSDHGHGNDEDDHEGHRHEHNAHIWLDAGNAAAMVANLAQGMMDALPQHADAIARNRDGYIARLNTLDAELTAALAPLPHKDIITFHEAFPYFAQGYGLHVAAILTRDPDDALSPRTMAELVETVRAAGNPPLFVEPQYEDVAAQTLSRETGDPCTNWIPWLPAPKRTSP